MLECLTALSRHAALTPDRPALADAEGWLTYGDLLDAVRRTAAWTSRLPTTVALLAPPDRRAVIWHLALAWAGRTIVPVPDFFSPSQRRHLVRDAGAGAILCAPEAVADAAATGAEAMTPGEAEPILTPPSATGRLIIYTSGTTGQPKGVVLGASQIDAGIHAMAEAVGARADDRMLAALPPALLLQQMAGMAVPLSVGAAVILCPDPRGFIQIAEATAPTATVLVPDMLAGWVTWLERTGRRAPASLRFVAVGGAPVPSHLAGRAWALGVPVHEGYGLSECCSVVAVNRPGQRRPGTVGRPLSGLRVTIDRGEIVVAGPTVMDGYLGGETSNGIRRTGDAGHFDDGGNLIVEGRIDDVIVTATGRNIHPEWIEAMILTDPGIARCAVVAGGTHPRAVVCQVDWQQPVIAPEDLDDLIAVLCADAPDYARPRGSVAISEADLRRLNLMTASGSLRRRAIGAFLKEMS